MTGEAEAPSQALFESFRALGLSEFDARAAASDAAAADAALLVTEARAFGRLSFAEAAGRLAQIAEAAGARLRAEMDAAPAGAAGSQVALDEAQLEEMIARAFRRGAKKPGPTGSTPPAVGRTVLSESQLDDLIAGAFGRPSPKEGSA